MTAAVGAFRVANTASAINSFISDQSITDAAVLHITPYGNNNSYVTITVIKK